MEKIISKKEIIEAIEKRRKRRDRAKGYIPMANFDGLSDQEILELIKNKRQEFKPPIEIIKSTNSKVREAIKNYIEKKAIEKKLNQSPEERLKIIIAQTPEERLKKSIKELNLAGVLTTVLANHLLRSEVTTLAELIKRKEDLLQMRGIGEKNFNKLKLCLLKIGISL